MDNLVDEILAPSVVDDAVAAKVQEIEDDYKQGPDGPSGLGASTSIESRLKHFCSPSRRFSLGQTQ